MRILWCADFCRIWIVRICFNWCMLCVSWHLYIVFRSFCSVLTSSSSVIERRTLVSSAKEETWLLVFSFMSPIRLRNSIGLRTVPWGTLFITWDIVEMAPFVVIYWVLSLRKLWIKVPTFPPIPSLFSLWHRIPWSTLSNAFAKSRYIWHRHYSPFLPYLMFCHKFPVVGWDVISSHVGLHLRWLQIYYLPLCLGHISTGPARFFCPWGCRGFYRP